MRVKPVKRTKSQMMTYINSLSSNQKYEVTLLTDDKSIKEFQRVMDRMDISKGLTLITVL